MITVVIYINGNPVFTRSAVNTTTKEEEMVAVLNEREGFKHIYKVDDGSILRHKKGDGAIKLAIQMLKTIKMPGLPSW